MEAIGERSMGHGDSDGMDCDGGNGCRGVGGGGERGLVRDPGGHGEGRVRKSWSWSGEVGKPR